MPIGDLNRYFSFQNNSIPWLAIAGVPKTAVWVSSYLRQYPAALFVLAIAISLHALTLVLKVIAWLFRGERSPLRNQADLAFSSRNDAHGDQGTDGTTTFVALLALQGVAADEDQIKHKIGGGALRLDGMLRLAKELGLKARVIKSSWPRLMQTPLPGIAPLKQGGFLLIARTDKEKALVLGSEPDARPRLITSAELEAEWDGRVLLVTTRAGLLSLARRFDITWFIGAVWKYRRFLSEVLAASFFLQIFALVSPLFFQVVIDKVLIHRTETTLDVLVTGLIFIAVFEAIMGGLRTYLFAHTANRIDVELGARLFRHLLALPLAYFQARRVGDSVARVRELENIRIFITSSALTLVIDLFFTFVFLAVMFVYSRL